MAMLNGGQRNCRRPNQHKRETKDARPKGVGSWHVTGGLKGDKLKEEAESRNDKPEDDDCDTGSDPREQSSLGGKEDARVRGRHHDRKMRLES